MKAGTHNEIGQPPTVLETVSEWGQSKLESCKLGTRATVEAQGSVNFGASSVGLFEQKVSRASERYKLSINIQQHESVDVRPYHDGKFRSCLGEKDDMVAHEMLRRPSPDNFART